MFKQIHHLVMLFFVPLVFFAAHAEARQISKQDITGVYVLLKGNKKVNKSDMSSTLIAGISIRTGWKILEPAEGEFQWTYIDDSIKAAKDSNKKVMVRVIPGIATPEWVYAAGAKKFEFMGRNPSRRPEGGHRTIPIPWDQVYLSKWSNFLRAFGKRYQKETTIELVQMAGPAIGGEMHLPKGRQAKAEWQKLDYTSDKLINAWKRVIDGYAKAFPNTFLAIDIAIPIFRDEVVEEVLAYGSGTYGRQFCVQGNWLSAHTQDQFPLYGLIKKYSSKSVVGFQMLRPATRKRGRKKFEDERKRAPRKFEKRRNRRENLREAIEKGLQAGAGYFEIYRADIMNPDLTKDIQYAVEKIKEIDGH